MNTLWQIGTDLKLKDTRGYVMYRYHQGDNANAFYIIKQGEISLRTSNYDGTRVLALDVSFRIDLSEPAPRAAGWVPTHRLTRVGCAPAPPGPTWALTQPALRPLAEQQPALTLAG